MNKTMLVGGISNPKINEAGTMAEFSVAVQRPYKDKDTQKYESDYIYCKMLGEKAVSTWRDRIVKGQKVEIEGTNRNGGKYEKDGKTQYGRDYVLVERFFPIGKAPEGTGTEAADNGNDGFVSVPEGAGDEGLPWD